MKDSGKVAVYGATGHTARFVTAGLERRGIAVQPITRRTFTASFRQENGGASTRASASGDDPDALNRALEGTEAAINGAGPFLDTAPAVMEAALRSGIHSLDLRAEQRSVRQILATYNAEAVDKRVVVLPAMACPGGLADLLAAPACRRIPMVQTLPPLDSLQHC